jgi:hypothetical protein
MKILNFSADEQAALGYGKHGVKGHRETKDHPYEKTTDGKKGGGII